MIHSPINGIIVEGAPEEAAIGVMTSFKRSELIQIHCQVILDPVQEGVTNPTVVSAPYTVTVDVEEAFCNFGSATLTADGWINRFTTIIYPEVEEYVFQQELFQSSSDTCFIHTYEIISVG